MYQALLTRKYLFSKVMPLLAAVAVLLCTTMVLITWSVMGGFLNMLIGTGRTMTGDVTIRWPTTGFAHYEELIRRLEADPMVAAAAPMVETPGIIHLPNNRNVWVLVRGVDGPSYARVTEYADILWWKNIKEPLPKDKDRLDPRISKLSAETWEEIYQHGLKLETPDPKTGEAKPAAVLGIEVSGFNRRDVTGVYMPWTQTVLQPNGGMKSIDAFLPRGGTITLNVLPTDSTGKGVETATAILPVANEFQSGLYETDKQVVLLRIDALQKMLHMDAVKSAAAATSGPETFEGVGAGVGVSGGASETPARVTDVLIKGKGTEENSKALKARVEQIYDQFARDYAGQVPDFPSILTWRELNGTFITAVEKETALVLVLFALISLVAVVLVLAIFWSMVAEKTKDIGILRAMGASRSGVAWVWVRYGLAIGIVGSILGGIASYLIVHNINPIHEWMGRALNITIWDPKVYYFIVIPNKVNPLHAAIVMVGFVLSCAVGALVPACRAAFLHPVRALRFE